MADVDDFHSEGQNGRHSSPRRRSRSPVRRSRSRSRSPRNWRRGERDSHRGREKESRPRIRDAPGGKVRLYVCNMPYDIKWQVLKDVFKKEVGSAVSFVELYETPDGKPSGAGVVEVRGIEQAEDAIDKMDRFEISGRKIIVREEREKDRQRHMQSGNRDNNRSDNMGGGGGGGNMGMNNMMGGGGGGMMGMDSGMGGGSGGPNTHGINPQLLQQLGIDSNNITNQIFVANLDYKVNERKVREIFKMAGTIIDVDMKLDSEQKFRGMCIIRFEHPVEAVQAISMFNGQVLYERTMSVKIDKMSGQDEHYSQQQIPNKLPSGLKSIGMGLGTGGTPVNIQQLQSNLLAGGLGGGNMNTGMGMNNMGMNPGMNPNMGGGMGSGMGGGGMNTAMGNVGMGNNMAGGMGGSNMGGMGGNTMGAMNTMGNMANMGTGLNTSMGAATMGNMGMGNMGMNTMANTGMGGTMSTGMGGDLTGSNMGMRTSMTSPTGMGNMGTGMDMNAGMGMNMNTAMANLGNAMAPMPGSNMGNMGNMGANMAAGNMGGNFMGNTGPVDNRGGGGGTEESTTVFVRNLPFSFSWTDLKSKFSKCGDVKFAEIKMENGKSKGYGTVRFMTPDDARRAVNLMNGARVDGRQLEVRLNRA